MLTPLQQLFFACGILALLLLKKAIHGPRAVLWMAREEGRSETDFVSEKERDDLVLG